MAGRAIRSLQVKSKHSLTPNMLRITLSGEALRDFPEGQESAYVKLRLHYADGASCVRSYTVRAFDVSALELVLDFVVHGDNGPASAWAIHAQVGDAIEIDGPGAAKCINTDADWVLLAGDMTALPAISANLERLPKSAVGHAVIELLDEADKLLLQKPENVTLHWVINSVPDKPNTVLVDAVKALPWLAGSPSVWVASEFGTMRVLRRYFKQERQVPRDHLYISSYWKMGVTDEGHKAAKKTDPEADK